MPAKLTGADRVDQALARVADEATGRPVLIALAELVVAAARPLVKSSRVRSTGRATASGNRGVAAFGSAATPWTAPSHFGHGSPSVPRAQGGWMPANPFLFKARDARQDELEELVLTGTIKALRRNGLA